MVSKQYKLSEAAKILGEKLETLRTKAKRGEIPTETTYEGNRPCKVISAETLANLLQNIDTSSYEDLKAQWQREMLAGTHSGTSTPVSENYMRDLQWGLKKYWLANPGREPVELLAIYKNRRVTLIDWQASKSSCNSFGRRFARPSKIW